MLDDAEDNKKRTANRIKEVVTREVFIYFMNRVCNINDRLNINFIELKSS